MDMITVSNDYFNKLYGYLNEEWYNQQPLMTENIAYISYDKDTPKSEIAEKVRTTLYNNGYAILSLPPCTCQEKLKAWQIQLFGPVMPDVGKHHVEISTIAPEKGGKYFANSTYAQPMHTDEGHTSRFPRVATLFCAKQSSEGGDSILVPFEPLYESLKNKFAENLSLLFDDKAITVNNIYGVESKSILLQLPEDRVGITYSSIVQGLTCSASVYAMFDYITEYVHKPENQLRVKLKEGDLLILDNCRMLHARTKFKTTDQRTLYRMWFPRLFAE
jgi:hypothetical protein